MMLFEQFKLENSNFKRIKYVHYYYNYDLLENYEIITIFFLTRCIYFKYDE